jgi:probable rRNA maturation factor
VELLEMAQLNKEYRNKEGATDVLSFVFNEDPPFNYMLGDVVLCPKEAQKRADNNGLSFNEWLYLLLVHGILHLLGYNHKSENDAEIMSKKEEEFLKGFFK